MVADDSSAGVDAVFHALAHAARRDMLRRLAEGDRSVGELAEPLAMSLAAVSKHVAVLERAGLVERRIAGRRHILRLVRDALAPAGEWLRDCGQPRLAPVDPDRLEDLRVAHPDVARQLEAGWAEVRTTLRGLDPAQDS